MVNLPENIIKQKPLLIIGTGIHKHLYNNEKNALSDWATLLFNVREKLKIVLPENNPDNLTLLWELMVLEATKNGIRHNNSWASNLGPASELESKLRKAVTNVISEHGGPAEKIDLVEKFNPSAILSLNFDDKWADGIKHPTRNKMTKKVHGILNNQLYQLFARSHYGDVPVYFPNGNVNFAESLRLGYRDFGLQTEGLRRAFGWFKNWERNEWPDKCSNDEIQTFLKEKLEGVKNYSHYELVESKITWVHHFMLNPILILGADIGPQEAGLRWLFMQRRRNFARKGNYPPTYRVTVNKKGRYRKTDKEYEALGIKTVGFESWKVFWDEVMVA